MRASQIKMGRDYDAGIPVRIQLEHPVVAMGGFLVFLVSICRVGVFECLPCFEHVELLGARTQSQSRSSDDGCAMNLHDRIPLILITLGKRRVLYYVGLLKSRKRREPSQSRLRDAPQARESG